MGFHKAFIPQVLARIEGAKTLKQLHDFIDSAEFLKNIPKKDMEEVKRNYYQKELELYEAESYGYGEQERKICKRPVRIFG